MGKKDQDKAAADKAAADNAAAELAAADKAAAEVKAAAEKSAAETAAKTAAAATPAKPGAPRRADKSERRWFAVSSVVLHDGEEVKPGEAAPFTRADFDQLHAVGIVKGDWEDGEPLTS